MEVTITDLSPCKKQLRIEIDAETVNAKFDAVAKDFRRHAHLPGFRPGKAPRKLLEARIGVAAGRQEAIQQSLPDYYGRALVENDIDAIDSPEIEITGGQEEGNLTFDAVVPVRPRATIAGYLRLCRYHSSASPHP